MAVFTEVSRDEAQRLMDELNLGELTELRGIEGGIENTNYFATTRDGAYVLTLFERLTFEQLPFYLYLMKHLATHGIPVPDPAANQDGADPAHRLRQTRCRGEPPLRQEPARARSGTLRVRGDDAGAHAPGRKGL